MPEQGRFLHVKVDTFSSSVEHRLPHKPHQRVCNKALRRFDNAWPCDGFSDAPYLVHQLIASLSSVTEALASGAWPETVSTPSIALHFS